MKISENIIVLALILIAAVVGSSLAEEPVVDEPLVYTGQTFDELKVIPKDSTDAQDIRVWLPLERQQVCRVLVRIYDKRGNEVRSLYEGQLGEGYYNFYWDKRNDKGRFVPEGKYVYRLDDCKQTRTWNLTVSYREGERDCLFFAPKNRNHPKFGYEVAVDSLPATIEILRAGGRLFQSVFSDSMLVRGQYRYEWQPDSTVPEGWYILKIMSGESTYQSKYRVVR